MARLLMILFSGLLLACTSADGQKHSWPKTDVGRSKLIGRVRSVDEIRYLIDDKGSKEGISRRHIQRFNANGSIVEDIDTAYLAGTAERRVIIYDDRGKDIEEDDYFGDTVIAKLVSCYSADGKRRVCVRYRDGVMAFKTVQINDARGNDIIDSSFNPGDSLTERRVSKYDSRDNLLSDSAFDANGLLTDATKYVYDKFNNETEWDMFNPRRNTHMIFKNKYDESDNPIEKENYFKNRLADKYTLKYEKRDKLGNWLVQKQYSAGKLVYITERVITYW